MPGVSPPRRRRGWARIGACVVVAVLALVSPSASAVFEPALVKAICASGACTTFNNVTDVGGTVFFRTYDATPGLWKTDGTQAGTELVKNVRVGAIAHVGATVYFIGPAPTADQADALWKSDGTEAGTVMVVDINPFPHNGGVFGFVGDVGGTLVFVGNDGTVGTSLWKSDGTAAGTVRIGPPPNSEVAMVGGTPLFQVGGALWKSDGTEAGTVPVKDIDPSCGFQFFIAVVDGTLFFRAADGVHGLELWKSDGTEAGTVLVKDIGASGGCSGATDPDPLAGAAGTLFFSANDGITGRELWKSDGTEAGTVLVKDINPGGDSDLSNAAAVGSTLFFSADDGIHEDELWKSDGTAAGTVLVKDINPDGNSFPESLINVDGTLYFTANDGTNGVELWQSDGTEAGTFIVKDLNPSGNSNPNSPTRVGQTLFFHADDGVNVALWRLLPDGDADGVPNATDACPTAAEDLDGVQDTDGCPETDADADGILDEVDELPETFSDRFSDVNTPAGGSTSGQIVARPTGTPPTYQVVDHPNPARGVRVTLTGGSGTCTTPATPCPRAEIRLDGKVSVTRLRSPGTYTVTDPTATLTVETELDGPAEVEVLGSVVVIEANEQATIEERDNDGNGTVDEATITPGQGDEITVNGQPTTQPTVVTGAPVCNGLTATIFVGTDGKIVGGPDNGKPYLGKLRGTAAANVIVGTGGVDDIDAKGGNDTVCGGASNDILEGAGGHDRLLGEDGNDRLLAGGGNDTLTGGLAADRFEGGSGRDTATDFNATQGDTKTSVEVF